MGAFCVFFMLTAGGGGYQKSLHCLRVGFVLEGGANVLNLKSNDNEEH